jgi:hypothetical protein
MDAVFSRVSFIALFAFASQSSAQDLSFLNSPPSVDAIGMGGVAASYPSDNALAVLGNPAQAGLFSLRGIASAGVNIPPPAYSDWWGDRSQNSSAAELGLNISRYLETPFQFSVGVGYSRISTNVSGYPFYRENNGADNLTVGVGLEDVVKVGIGFTYKWVSSNFQNQPDQNWEGSVTGYDYGAIVQVPIMAIIEGRHESIDRNQSALRPLANFNIAYAMKSLGGYLNYNSDPALATGLPRQAVLGLNFEFGVDSRFDGLPWKILSIVFAREADEPLMRLDSTLDVMNGDSVFYYNNVYTNSPRYINLYKNFILGNSEGKVGVRTGIQVQTAEFLYVRFGATAGPNLKDIPSFGIGVRLKGLLRLIYFIDGNQRPQSEFISFIMNHIDLQYDYSRLTYSAASGQSFDELNLVVR